MNLLSIFRKIGPRSVLVLGLLNGLLMGCLAASPMQNQQPVVSFVTKVPPQIILPPAVRQVALINRFEAARLRYTKKRKTEAFRAGAAEAVETVISRLAAEPSLQLMRHDTLVEGSAATAPPLAAAVVQLLCRQWHTSHLLALEGFDAVTRKEGIGWEKNSDGSGTKSVAYALVVRTRWTLYDAKGRILDQSKAEAARPYERTAGSYEKQPVENIRLAFGPALATAGDAIRELAGSAGAQYARRYLPRDTIMHREYYAGGALTAAADRLQQHDWVGAAALLKDLAANPDALLASRAAHNLSVVYEATADLAEALRWAAQAQAKAPGDLPVRRVQVLLERQQATTKGQAQRPTLENTPP